MAADEDHEDLKTESSGHSESGVDWESLVEGASPVDKRFGEGSDSGTGSNSSAASSQAPPAVAGSPIGWQPLSEYLSVPVETSRETHDQDGRLMKIWSSNSAGVSHGPEVALHGNGMVRRRQHFRDGILDGTFEAFFDTGMLRVTGAYKDNKQDGVWERYSSEGALLSSKSYSAGKLQGPYIIWYHSGSPKTEAEYAAGLQTGTERQYGESSLERTYEWRTGERHGPFVEYDPLLGSITLQGSYEDGLRVGTWTQFSPEGSILSEQSFLLDQLEGVSKRWNADGRPELEETYSGGELSGSSFAWHPNGQMQMQGEFVRGLREGAWSFWKADGSVDSTFSGTYREGSLIPNDEQEQD